MGLDIAYRLKGCTSPPRPFAGHPSSCDTIDSANPIKHAETGGKLDSQATLILRPDPGNIQDLPHDRVGPQSNCVLLARKKNAAGIGRIIKIDLLRGPSLGPFLERGFPGRTRVESQLGPDRGRRRFWDVRGIAEDRIYCFTSDVMLRVGGEFLNQRVLHIEERRQLHLEFQLVRT